MSRHENMIVVMMYRMKEGRTESCLSSYRCQARTCYATQYGFYQASATRLAPNMGAWSTAKNGNQTGCSKTSLVACKPTSPFLGMSTTLQPDYSLFSGIGLWIFFPSVYCGQKRLPGGPNLWQLFVKKPIKE